MELMSFVSFSTEKVAEAGVESTYVREANIDPQLSISQFAALQKNLEDADSPQLFMLVEGSAPKIVALYCENQSMILHNSISGQKILTS